MARPKMQEIEGPKQVGFKTDGTTHEGIFIGTEPRMIEDVDDDGNKLGTRKQVTVYQFAEADFSGDAPKMTGQEFEFLEAADLRKKLNPALVGKFVSVTRTSDRIRTNGGPMVVFKVQASAENYLGR
jgi:hypothetical protein